MLGFIGGFRHAFEPDHVVAVSTLLGRHRRMRGSLRAAAAWGLGHTTTLVLGVPAIGLFRLPLSESFLGYLELPVAVMLACLGIRTLWDLGGRLRTLRRHRHDGVEHFHVGPAPHPHDFPTRRSGWGGYLVGLVHGFAGSGALFLLIAATLPSIGAGLLYALVFGIGSLAGMAAVTLAMAASLQAAGRKPIVHAALTGLSGGLSIMLAIGIVASL